MERDKQILRYSSTNPLLDCVVSRKVNRVITLEKLTWYPISGNILCEFYHTENSCTYIFGDLYPKLVNFIKRFGHTLD